MYIYTFWSHDSHRNRAIKYLNFESNVDVHFCLTPSPQCLHVSSSACGRLLRMTPYPYISTCTKLLYIVYTVGIIYGSRIKTRHRSLARQIKFVAGFNNNKLALSYTVTHTLTHTYFKV